MRVNLIKENTVLEESIKHSNGRTHFRNFLNSIKYADWEVPNDITDTYAGNLLGGDRVVFDLGGNGKNAFRIICTFQFRKSVVFLWVEWIGTHEEYNDLSNDDKMTISNY